MPPINAIPGDPNANSYLTLTRANALADLMTWAAQWAQHGNAREGALQHATIRLTEEIAWKGQPTNDTQALAWPRRDVWHRESDTYWPDDVIPLPIERATLFDAMWLLTTESEPFSDVRDLEAYRFEDIRMEFRPQAPRVFSREVLRLVRPYAIMVPGSMGRRVTR